MSEVISRTECVLHENQSVNQGQFRALDGKPAAQAHTTDAHTQTLASRAPIPPRLAACGGQIKLSAASTGAAGEGEGRMGGTGTSPQRPELRHLDERWRPQGGAPGRGRPESAARAPRTLPRLCQARRGAALDRGCRRSAPWPGRPGSQAKPGSPGRLSIHWVVCRESSPPLCSHREAQRGRRARLCVGGGQVVPHA